MPIVCIDRKNRTKKPKWTPCDAARVSRAAVKSGSSRDAVTATVGYSLGYYKIIDGSKLTSDELQKTILNILQDAQTISEITSAIPQLRLLGITIQIMLRFASATASLLAPLLLVILNKYEIKGAQACKTRN